MGEKEKRESAPLVWIFKAKHASLRTKAARIRAHTYTYNVTNMNLMNKHVNAG